VASGPYSRVYWTVVDDPMFEGIFDTPVLATWLRMLLMADAMYPASAPIGRRNSDVRRLVAAGLVIEKPGNRYSMRGLDAERERRSRAGRNAAAMRWQSGRNADAMPRREEQSKDEKSSGNGMDQGNAMGWRIKPTQAEVLADINRQHAESLQDLTDKAKALGATPAPRPVPSPPPGPPK